MSKYWATPEGNYVIGYISDIPPERGVEVPIPPNFDTDIWDGVKWSAGPNGYIAQRAAVYPPMTDYLDGIVKGDTAQVQAYVDACLAVKAKYPKP